jgi:hypothetical protein
MTNDMNHPHPERLDDNSNLNAELKLRIEVYNQD